MEKSNRFAEQADRSKRRFIADGVRNAAAIGAIAAGLMVEKTSLALAHDRGEGREHGHANCFLKGTKIQTVQGERNVEDLAVGDLLPAVFGGVRPVRWVGRYKYKKSANGRTWVKDVRPVRIAASSLAPDVPHADLYVTQLHALYLDGILVTADRLINGATITLYDADEYDELEYFHIKLESHDVIYAEGAPCETLVNVCDNAVNFAEYLRRYGVTATPDVECAPCFRGARGEMRSRLKHLATPWRGPEKFDLIRHHLRERAILLSGKVENVAVR